MNPGVQKPHWNAALLDERLLNRVQRASVGEPFDRHHLCAIDERGQIQAARHGRAVHEHRAAAAQSLPAALARAEQAELALQHLDHRLVYRDPGGDRPAVEREADRPPVFVIHQSSSSGRPSASRIARSTRSGVSGRSVTTIADRVVQRVGNRRRRTEDAGFADALSRRTARARCGTSTYAAEIVAADRGSPGSCSRRGWRSPPGRR